LARQEITVPAELSQLPLITEFVVTAAREAGMVEESLPFLDMALEELATNVIKYAYPDQPGYLRLVCTKDENDHFFLSLIDQGPSFNPLEAPPPDLTSDVDQRRPGGLGIYLTAHLAGRLEYHRKNQENLLTLIMPLTPEKKAK
jgi:serine/threonine-protein kinase RsbW